MKRSLVLALFLASTSLAGCDLFLGDTKMSKGVLYQSGDEKYDAFFEQVHREQLAAANWADEAKASRKPIVTALSLKPDASNGTIMTATRDMKSGAAALGPPVERTTASEAERARKLTAEAKRLEELRERGHELHKQASEDKDNLGAKKADDKVVAKKTETKREISASVDAIDKMMSDARRGAREAEELATKLTAAWTGNAEDEKPLKSAEPAAAEPKKKPEPPAKKPAAAPKPASGPAPAPAPKPAPKPAPDEVFNP